MALTCGFPCDKPCAPFRKGMGFGTCIGDLSGLSKRPGLALVTRLKQLKKGLDVTRELLMR